MSFGIKTLLFIEQFGIKVKGKIEKPAVIYIDTDSCYVQFQDLYESIIWPDETKKLKIDEFILSVLCIQT